MKQSLIDATTVKFLIVGSINTFLGMCIMFSLYNLAGWSYWLSSSANYVIGGIVSFLLNKYFTFQRNKWSGKQVGKFALTVMVCYLLAYGIAKPLTFSVLVNQSVKVQEGIAMLMGMCLYTGLNYLGQKFFVFS